MTSYIKNANCFSEFKNIRNHSIDFVCVDLPYGQTACEWDTCIDLKVMWVELKRIIKQGAYIAFFCTTKFVNTLINSNPKWFRYDLVWEKSHKVGFLNSNKMPLRAHEMIYIFRTDTTVDTDLTRNTELKAYAQKIKKYINKPIKTIRDESKINIQKFYCNGKGFGLITKTQYEQLTSLYKLNEMKDYKDYEHIEAMYEPPIKIYNPQKTKGKPYPSRSDSYRTKVYGKTTGYHSENKGDRHPTSIVKFSNPAGKAIHNTQKPVDLLEWLIKTYSNENDMVLDFTMGSGSTIIAAINTKRRYIGIEMNNEIFTIAENRINEILNSNNI